MFDKGQKQSRVLSCDSSYLWVHSFTGMDIITGMDYRNGHNVVTLGALNVF